MDATHEWIRSQAPAGVDWSRPHTGAMSTIDEAAVVPRERLAALTLEQKVRLLTGADFWALNDEPAAGLRRLVISDGPAGVRGERWDERDPSANVPSPTALAATWDEERVERARPPAGRRVPGARASTSSSRRRSTCTGRRTAAGTSSASARTRC